MTQTARNWNCLHVASNGTLSLSRSFALRHAVQSSRRRSQTIKYIKQTYILPLEYKELLVDVLLPCQPFPGVFSTGSFN